MKKCAIVFLFFVLVAIGVLLVIPRFSPALQLSDGVGITSLAQECGISESTLKAAFSEFDKNIVYREVGSEFWRNKMIAACVSDGDRKRKIFFVSESGRRLFVVYDNRSLIVIFEDRKAKVYSIFCPG